MRNHTIPLLPQSCSFKSLVRRAVILKECTGGLAIPMVVMTAEYILLLQRLANLTFAGVNSAREYIPCFHVS